MTTNQILFKIFKAKELLNLSYADLSKLCDVDSRTIRKMINDTRNSRIDTVIKVLDSLGYELTVKRKDY